MLNLTNSRLKNYDTGRGEGVKLEKQLQKLFGIKKIGIRNYTTCRKHFRKNFTWKFFHHF